MVCNLLATLVVIVMMLVRVVVVLVVVVVMVVVVVLVIAEVATKKGKVKFHCGPIDTVSSITERKGSKLASG